MSNHLKSFGYILYFTIYPFCMIGGVLMLLYNYPEIPLYGYVLLCLDFLMLFSTKKINASYSKLRQEMDYDEYGRRKGMEDYSRLSKREREQLDKQKLADMERIVSSSALKKMTKPGSMDPETDMKKLVGLSVVKEQMAVMAARMEYDRENRKKKKYAKEEDISRHMIFSGAPGTGKTTVARIMTGFLYKNGFIRENKCLEVDGNFLKASTTADTAAKTELVVRASFGGVLFIDEAYALLSGDAAGEAAVATLIKQMEDNRDKFILIIAGYTDEIKRLMKSNPGFTSRFKDFIEFPDYTEDELAQLFTMMIYEKGLCVTTEALDNFHERIRIEKKRPAFGNGRTVRNIMEESIDMHAYHVKTGKLSQEDKFKLTDMDVSSQPRKTSGWEEIKNSAIR